MVTANGSVRLTSTSCQGQGIATRSSRRVSTGIGSVTRTALASPPGPGHSRRGGRGGASHHRVVEPVPGATAYVVRAGSACPSTITTGRLVARAVHPVAVDRSAVPGTSYCYSVFALDRYHTHLAAASSNHVIARTPPSPSPAIVSSSLVKAVGAIALGGVLLLTAMVFLIVRLNTRDDWQYGHPPRGGRAAIGGYASSALVIPVAITVVGTGAVNRGGAVGLMRTRLVIAAAALGALAFVPGAVATTGGTFSANDPSFGSVAVGTHSNPTTVTIVNHTHTAHTINSLSKGGTNPAQFSIATDNCSGVVLSPNGGANDSCSLGVTFSPVGSAGARNAQIGVTYDGGSTQSDVSELNGTASAPAPAVSVNDIDFGTVKVGGSKVATLTVTNTGNAPLHITTITKTGGSAFTFSNDHCSQSTVAAGDNCTIGVTFAPVQPSVYASAVTITDNAGNVAHSTQTADLNGTGLSSFVTFTPTPYDYGASIVGKPGGPVQFTLHNQDAAPLTLPAQAFANVSGNTGAFKVTGDGCSGSTVPANSTCNFSVVYTATAVGHQAVGIAVADSAPDAPQTLALTGTGNAPPPFINFRGAVGCTTATLQWTLPSGVFGSWIVRNPTHVPKNPHDGTRIRRTGPGVAAGTTPDAVSHLPLRDLCPIQVPRLQAGGVLRAAVPRPAHRTRVQATAGCPYHGYHPDDRLDPCARCDRLRGEDLQPRCADPTVVKGHDDLSIQGAGELAPQRRDPPSPARPAIRDLRVRLLAQAPQRGRDRFLQLLGEVAWETHAWGTTSLGLDRDHVISADAADATSLGRRSSPVFPPNSTGSSFSRGSDTQNKFPFTSGLKRYRDDWIRTSDPLLPKGEHRFVIACGWLSIWLLERERGSPGVGGFAMVCGRLFRRVSAVDRTVG